MFDIGGMRLKVLETPGHSPESLSFVLYPSNAVAIPWSVFTGDALFYGNTGRTDLFGDEKTEEYASILYDSIHGKLLSLGDGVVVYPAHGSGSACGGSMSDIEISTIGYERATNPMLRAGRGEFIQKKKNENIPLPPYFARMADYNLNGPPRLLPGTIEPMDASVFASNISECAVVDTRSPLSFAGGHIKGSYNIWLHGLATFPGWIIDYEKDILLITERQEDEGTARLYLSRIGFDRVRGYLCKGIIDWYGRGMPLEHSGVMTVENLHEKLKEEDIFLLDVRAKEEYEQGHIPGAVNIYVGELEKRTSEVPPDKTLVSACSSGYRSGLAASILARKGFGKVNNLIGGTTAWKEKGYQTKREQTRRLM
ncbi:Thiosulfate sulfurtransferase GlpE [uncultured archaeon]|nr:Thiosulfate sulfurtransferase GlpE [uncultured archaeon]